LHNAQVSTTSHEQFTKLYLHSHDGEVIGIRENSCLTSSQVLAGELHI